jgi:ATP-dependent DNA helicase RecG
VPPTETKLSPLAAPVTTLWGVADKRAEQLHQLGIQTVEDLLLHRPRRYEDRRHLRPIGDLQLDEPATVRGSIVAAGVKRWKKGTRAMFECVFDDGTARLHCRWWKMQPWMEDYYAVGREFLIFGKAESLRPRTIDHPETELVEGKEEEFIHLNRITPIYPLTEGLPQRWLRGLIWRTLEKYERQIADKFQVSGAGFQVPPRTRGTSIPPDTSHLAPDTSLPTRARAVRLLHFPAEEKDIEIARRRLALDEFIELQRQLRLRRKNFETRAQALPCGGDNRLIKPFLARLGFKLTGAQTSVLRQIRKDMSGPHPMRRLLQGDVGSGKTVVAACSALMAIESGFNVALMAPTEILAEQHFRNFQRWFEPLGVRVELRTGTHKQKSDKWQVTSDMKPHVSDRVTRHLSPVTLFIGTHALIESGFAPENLGLVIIDEQHRFGVAQREELVRKGRYPHLLVMTATPIPRTLGLTLYGDLDVCVIDEMPAGRGLIKTFVRASDKLPQVWEFVRQKLGEGRQAYVVYPRVEESGESGLKAVTKEFGNLKTQLAPFRVGLLHGRLSGKEKEDAMAAFRASVTQVLLATSLIEVGVDVPNATITLIENAEQFGLAQLHQLRGRIGRGAHDSFCILIATATNEAARERLKIMEETNDGFRLAEEDLKLRGPGELLGQQQSGMPRFRFGDLVADLDLIKQARDWVAHERPATVSQARR